MYKAIGISLLSLVLLSFSAIEYPIDGYLTTGIKRLRRLELALAGDLPDARLPTGAYRRLSEIQLNLQSRKNTGLDSLLTEDPELQKRINTLFPKLDKSYSITVFDMTNPDSVRYAQQNENRGYQPGSVGKLVIVTALFDQLARLYPDSWDKRVSLLKNRTVRGGEWVLTDEHTVPVFNVENNTLVKRQVVADDVFSLYEWVDHMLSVSNNGAASLVWRETLLMAVFGDNYENVTQNEIDLYFKNTPRTEITDLANEVINSPLRKLGISEDEWRLGSFFTRGSNKFVGNKGGSQGTPLGLMKWMVQLEQGKVIDEQSSLEIKRLMYMTDRRIRYAQAPELREAAVYFKSGSLYSCDRSKGEACGKYMGNVANYMNSVAIVEHPTGTKYMVCLMSNVLRKNSSGDHLALASKIDRIFRK